MDDARQLLDIAAIRTLPRSTTPWQMSFRAAPKEADRAGMYRLLIIVSAGANTIRLMRATTEASLPADVVVTALEDAMTQAEGDLVPARPPRVLVDDPELFEALQLPMQSCGVEVQLSEKLPAIDPVMEALEQKPGLFSDRTLIGAACFEAELADAAARIAAAEPWRYFLEETPFAVHLEPDSTSAPAHIVVVMGTMGQLHGIACYDEDTYDQAIAVQEAPPPPGSPFPFGGWSLVFEPACSTSAAHRRALANRNLPIAHALYPQFRQFRVGAQPGEITNRHDARRVQRVLNAVVALIEERGEQLLDHQWHSSDHELPGGHVRIVARPDLAHAEVFDDDDSPFIEESPFGSDELMLDGLLPEGSSVSEDDFDPERRLIPADHMMLVTDVPRAFIARAAPTALAGGGQEEEGDEVPCLVIRSTKKNARLAAKALRDLDTLAFGTSHEDGRDLEIIFGFSAGEQLGVVSIFGTTHDQPLLSEEIGYALSPDVESVVVVLVGGGTRRPPAQLDADSVVDAVRLGLVRCEVSTM